MHIRKDEVKADYKQNSKTQQPSTTQQPIPLKPIPNNYSNYFINLNERQ